MIIKNIASIVLASNLFLTGCSSMMVAQDSDAPEPKEVDTEQNFIQAVRAGDAAYQRGNFDDALIQYTVALANDNTNVDTYYKVGTIHRLRKKLDLAEVNFKRALRVDSNHVGAREGLGLTLMGKENLSSALILFETVLEDIPDRWQTLGAMGVLHDLIEDYTSAQDYYKHALEKNPRSAKIKNNLAYSYYLEGDLAIARSEFQSLVSAHPKFEQGWANLALVYARLDQQDEARAAFGKIGDAHQAENNLGYVNLLQDNTQQASANFEIAIKQAPTYYGTAHKNLAAVKSGDQIPVVSLSSMLPVKRAKSRRRSVEHTVTESVGVSNSASRFDQIRPREYSAEVLQVQQRLVELGYLSGKVDGKLGLQTRASIKTYQRDVGIAITGEVDRSLFDKLLIKSS